jgi:hypothetical protein
MRGRDVRTREIKTMRLVPGATTTESVAEHFGLI